MTEARYKIVFDGKLMPEMALDTVKDNLARLFKSDQSKIDALFTGSPVALKRDLAEAEADKYLAVLQNAGAQVRKEQDLAAGLSLVAHDDEHASAPTNSESMSCPKCGQQQAKAAECASCGIIIDKYLARQAQLAENPPVAAPAASATVSPYSTPKAEVGETLPEYGELKVFSINGRIGRVRYLGWYMGVMLLAMLGYAIAAGIMAVAPIIGGILMIPLVIATVVVSVQVGVQRLHDLGWSGWLLLINLIPIVGSVFALLMLVVPGNQGANRYGPPPPPNSTGVAVLAWSGLLVPILGILAAIAIPAYHDYTERALEAQQQQYAPADEE